MDVTTVTSMYSYSQCLEVQKEKVPLRILWITITRSSALLQLQVQNFIYTFPKVLFWQVVLRHISGLDWGCFHGYL